tara:strand:- start:789 stop:1469 length:681 start_codon:yes stop_codon:yes gene_type:complete
MADLTGQSIQNSYPRVIQVDNNQLQDGTGSNLPISFNGNNVIISGSLTAFNYIVSSSITNIVIATKSGSTAFGNTIDDTHTFTGHITASGKLKVTSTAQDAISTNGNIIGGNKISSRTGSFNLLTLTQGAAQDSGEEGDANLTFIGLQNILRAFSNTENSAVERGYNNNVGFIENFASTIGSFGTGTTIINDNVSSSGFVAANNITASGNISASGELIGIIRGGTF